MFGFEDDLIDEIEQLRSLIEKVISNMPPSTERDDIINDYENIKSHKL